MRNTWEGDYSPAKQFNLYPIGCDEGSVPDREEVAEVGAPPEIISGKTASGKLGGECHLISVDQRNETSTYSSVHKRQVRDSFF